MSTRLKSPARRTLLSLLAVSAVALFVSAPPAFAGSGTVTVEFKASDNTTGVAGGIVEYYKSGWQLLGTTDGSGMASGFVDLGGTKTTTDFRLRWYGGTKAWSGVNVTGNPILTANTTPVTVKLETCAGAPLGGKAYWNAGQAWGGYNLIGTSPSNTELLPGSYTFRINYSAHNGANASFNNTKNQNITGDPVVVFNTTKVTLFGSNITYYENNPTSGWVPFTSPSEMLPGTVSSFRFNGVPQTVAISGCSLTGGLLTLKDENGNGVAGGKATPAIGGAWQPTLPGTTNASGTLFASLPAGTTKVRMEVNQGSVEQTTAQMTASNATWVTEILRIYLKDHTGAAITDGLGTLAQGGGYWYSWGNFNAFGYKDIPLFARASAYKFKATYNATGQELFPVVSTGVGIQEFDFQTGQVIGTCITQYASGGWQTFTSGMELMPGTYTFKNPSQSGTVTAGGTTTLTCP